MRPDEKPTPETVSHASSGQSESLSSAASSFEAWLRQQLPEARRLANHAEESLAAHIGKALCTSAAADKADECTSTSTTGSRIETTDWCIGRFQLIRPLGDGGQGSVLLARDPELDQNVALKVPDLQIQESTNGRTLFRNEAQAVAALRGHPHVITIYDVGEDHGLCFLAMEYCPDGSLAGWIRNEFGTRGVPPRIAADIIQQIADGVHFAHTRGVFHRDLKPANILIRRVDDPVTRRTRSRPDAETTRLTALVADFGLAHRMPDPSSDAELRLAGATLGTWRYMAPEQARGDPEVSGAAIDVYGLGAILFELLTGQSLFADPAIERDHLRARIRSEPRPRPRDIRPDLPLDLDLICARCLALQPEQRYRTAEQVGDALRAYLRDDPIPGHPATIARRIRSLVRRRPRMAAFVASGFLIAGLGIGWSDYRHRQDAKSWLLALESASIANLPRLVSGHAPNCRLVKSTLERLSQSRDERQRLAACAVLAPFRGECADYALTGLLRAAPKEIEALSAALDGRVPNLRARLERTIEARPAASTSLAKKEELDRHRANAATALSFLGDTRPVWKMLAFRPDPQARSFLIHTLGQASVPPGFFLERLERERDPSVRRALLLALGESDRQHWANSAMTSAVQAVLLRYRTDPDPGVHAAAKWTLQRWVLAGNDTSLHAQWTEADRELARRKPDDSAHGWRITPSGMTFVRLDVPPEVGGAARVIEVSDSEIAASQFLRLIPDFPYDAQTSPTRDCPINTTTWNDAARFCLRLDREAGVPDAESVYREAPDGSCTPVPHAELKHGFRLLTAEEFVYACRAGTSTRRFYGDTTSLLGEYVAYRGNAEHAQPVAVRKPNDFGFFDMLGNVTEWCDRPVTELGSLYQATIGFSITAIGDGIRSDNLRAGRNSVTYAWPTLGFRVARTIADTPRSVNPP